ncbi:MAG: T9SS type A sorting domain-containing protein, partial [Bacteroidia bacterium]
ISTLINDTTSKGLAISNLKIDSINKGIIISSLISDTISKGLIIANLKSDSISNSLIIANLKSDTTNKGISITNLIIDTTNKGKIIISLISDTISKGLTIATLNSDTASKGIIIRLLQTDLANKHDTVYVASSINNDTLKISIHTGISPTSPRLNSLKVYPNPASNYLVIDLENPGYFIAKLTGISGQTTISQSNTTIDISSLSNGIYILTIFDDENKLISTNKVAIIR